MSMMAAAASAYDEHLLRRAQSTGDLPNPAPSTRPSRHGSLHRSEGVVQRPEPLHVHPGRRAPHTSFDSLEAALAQINETPRADPRLPRNRPPQQRPEDVPTLLDKLLMMFGLSGADAKARREFIAFVWNVGFAIAQYIIIITLLAYSAHHESPTQPGLSEWDACSRPLGVWDSIWLIRVALGLLLSIWGYRRDRATRLVRERRERNEEVESPRPPAIAPHRFPRERDPRAPPMWANDDYIDRGNHAPERASPLYSRLSLLCTIMSLAWFLTAHTLEYTSVNDCRHSSPHLWWLTFGILCILYLMVLEIFLLGLLVFVFGPVLYLLWNVILLCLGRHPLQNPHQIKPEIGKLPRHVVDQIPLAPREGAEGRGEKGGDAGAGGAGDGKGGLKREMDPEKMTWEDRWESGDYPFVRLEGNRAVCAICLLDFEPPKRVDGAEEESEEKVREASEDTDDKDDAASGKVDLEAGEREGEVADGEVGAPDESVHEVQVDEVTEEDRQQLRLDDAGEGAVPLRLLACGHVFHQTCVDPWLTDVSGRCPVCQRPVMDPTKTKSKRGESTQ
ncbi:uncharacterized protein B0H18DRAFT_975121 [Fomitopsis serialis]|uniref:uncharacterized protein n=1 Tax=Fomitopsis serialis TaxID=139415 RepID=UPI0020075759|nr:uncharacterized protein B0H18DRAFT_975121 [Neoantrodia serialis]KAH9935285.1 hypothetical protein B0H18DRAFT_975121 [Neoantrodia serialis]